MKLSRLEFASAATARRESWQFTPLVGGTLVLLLSGAPLAASAASYFVRVDGSDTACNGSANAASSGSTPNCAFLTVQKSANVAVAGDNVNIRPGTFAANVNLTKAGTGSNPIVFSGPGATIKGNLEITGQYLTVDGLTVSPPTTGNLSAVNVAGAHISLRNCTVTAYGAPASDQATAINLEGSFNTVESCTIRDMNDIDVFHVWGHDNAIRNNFVTNIQQVNYTQNHTDFIQSWGYAGAQAYNILIEGNVVINSSMQLGNTETDGQAGLHDWTFRNNVFANIDNAFFSGIPATRFYNNVFYNVGKNQGYAVSLYTQTDYSSVGDEIVNNAFIANIGDVDFHSTAASQLAAYTNNFFATANGGTKSGSLGSAAINGGDPKFKSAAAQDFHLLAGSVLIGRAKSLASNFTTDNDGNSRGATWDMGAFVYGGVVPPSGVKVTP